MKRFPKTLVVSVPLAPLTLLTPSLSSSNSLFYWSFLQKSFQASFFIALLMTSLTFTGCGKSSSPGQGQAEGPASVNGRSIYGEDNRKEFCEVDPSLQALAPTIGLFITQTQLQPKGSQSFSIKASALKDSSQFKSSHYLGRPLCPSVRFQNQLSLGNCSGFLVGPDLMITAGHCVKNDSLSAPLVKDPKNPPYKEQRILFNMVAPSCRGQSNQEEVVNQNNIYSIKKVLAYKKLSKRGDFALIQLDRPVPQARPLKLEKDFLALEGEELLMVGHPVGLPMKFTEGGRVSKETPFAFTASLDAFSGNSGSPVFSATRKDDFGRPVVVGILTEGKIDYQLNAQKTCIEESVYDPELKDGDGEGIIKIQTVLSPSTLLEDQMFDQIEELNAWNLQKRQLEEGLLYLYQRRLPISQDLMDMHKDLVQKSTDAVGSRQFAKLSQLVRQGAKINTFDFEKYTPLMKAIVSGHTALVQYLVENQADIYLENERGESALSLAKLSPNTKITSLLLNRGL